MHAPSTSSPSAPEIARAVRGWHVLAPGEASDGAREIPMWPVSRGSAGMFLDPRDGEALRTWDELRRPGNTGRVRSALSFARALRSGRKGLSDARGWRLACESPWPRGAVALLRSQKLIVADRLGGVVVKCLLDGSEDSALLAFEAKVGEILPKHSIPTLGAQLDREPQFVVQPYVRAFPRSWREALPDFDRVIEILFDYYSHFGFEEVASNDYVAGLEAKVAAGVAERGIESVYEGLRQELARSLPAAERVALTQVHGDLIPGHIVWRSGAEAQDPLLIDWSESHRYTAFHDLFYFQFQNHKTDFWDRWGSLDEAGLAPYFGAGYERLWALLSAQTTLRRSFEAFRANIGIAFLQELEHRLNRLQPRFLPFWVQQTERWLASLPSSP